MHDQAANTDGPIGGFPDLVRPGPSPDHLALPAEVLAALHGALREVSERTIVAVELDVPGYRGTLDSQARATLGQAVELALQAFLALASAPGGDASAPMAPAVQGAYALGRGEARAGRSMDALLAAYRVGARVAWRGLADAAADAGLGTAQLVLVAELVFAYIDRLSAASVTGHADELASEGLVRARHLERLGYALATGAAPDSVRAAAERARWTPPDSIAAVLLDEAHADTLIARVDARSLRPIEEVPDLPTGVAILLVADPTQRLATALGRLPSGAHSVQGPTVPWHLATSSYRRALRAWTLGLAAPGRPLIADDVLAELVIGADPDALAELRARVLAPLDALPAATAERLAETLRAWLLLRGRRDEVAAELHVHAQTVRYRMGQLRTLLGDRLDDPRGVLELTIALALPSPRDIAGPSSRRDPSTPSG